MSEIKDLINQGMNTMENLKLLTIVEPIKSEVLKIEKEFGSFGNAPAVEVTERLLQIVLSNKSKCKIVCDNEGYLKVIGLELRNNERKGGI